MRVTGVLMGEISVARQAAFDVLQSVARGGYASDILRARTRQLTSRDAGLAGQIAFGCLRFQAQLDHLIARYSGRNPGELDQAVRIILRTAIFQLRYLTKIPTHAAVHEAVELTKLHKRAAAGFVNAVLRKVNCDPVPWPDLATELSCPAWLLDRWTGHFGAEPARKIAAAALEEPVPYMRNQRFHDIGSQAIVPLLDLQPGQTYLDLCAAPGNKTLQALETPLALAVACDISPRRIRDIPPVCPRVVLDATRPLPFEAKFDRIFIDAPCSGTGTLSRNPEIKWRVQQPDFANFHARQVQIALQAVRLLAPDGKLLYATCSLESEENEDVVRTLMERVPELQCERTLWRLPGHDEGDGFYAALLSWV
jgi:16S rRNA (cytosine967-C5)-methyltransferase